MPNAPQVVTTSLEVLDPSANPGAVISPAELAFRSSPSDPPGSQDLLLYNLSGTPVSYRSRVVTAGGENWVMYAPANGTIRPEAPLRVVVQPLLRTVIE